MKGIIHRNDLRNLRKKNDEWKKIIQIMNTKLFSEDTLCLLQSLYSKHLIHYYRHLSTPLIKWIILEAKNVDKRKEKKQQEEITGYLLDLTMASDTILSNYCILNTSICIVTMKIILLHSGLISCETHDIGEGVQ